MTRREDQMRGRIHDVEDQLVKAAIMITEARERAEAAEEDAAALRDALKQACAALVIAMGHFGDDMADDFIAFVESRKTKPLSTRSGAANEQDDF